jgi:hypothetical protein
MIYGTFIEAFGQFSRQIEFLSKAIGHDETRPMFHHILIEPSEANEGKFRAIASDGRRLHMIDPLVCPDHIGLEAGLWRFLRSTPKGAWIAKTITDKEAFAFPNYKRVIPTDPPGYQTDYHSGFLPGSLRGDALVYAVKFINAFPVPTVINPAYLTDLGNETWKVSWYEANKTVVFESGSYKAVIMPMRLE